MMACSSVRLRTIQGISKKSGKLAGLLPPVSRYHFIAAIVAGQYNGGLCHSFILNAFRHRRHFLVVANGKGMVFESVKLGQVEKYTLFRFALAWGFPRFGRPYQQAGPVIRTVSSSSSGSHSSILVGRVQQAGQTIAKYIINNSINFVRNYI